MSAPISLRTESPPLISPLNHYDELLQHRILLVPLSAYHNLSPSLYACACVRVHCVKRCWISTDTLISFLQWNVSLNKVVRISISPSVYSIRSEVQVIASIFTGCLILLYFISFCTSSNLFFFWCFANIFPCSFSPQEHSASLSYLHINTLFAFLLFSGSTYLISPASLSLLL